MWKNQAVNILLVAFLLVAVVVLILSLTNVITVKNMEFYSIAAAMPSVAFLWYNNGIPVIKPSVKHPTGETYTEEDYRLMTAVPEVLNPLTNVHADLDSPPNKPAPPVPVPVVSAPVVPPRLTNAQLIEINSMQK